MSKSIVTDKDKKYIKDLQSELSALGYGFTSIWDFVNSKDVYRSALPVLLKYLPLIEDGNTKEGIIRALTIRGYMNASQLLIKEYKKTSDAGIKWVIGNALNQIAKGFTADDIIALLESQALPTSFRKLANNEIKDPKVSAVETLLWSLGRTKDRKALPVLKQYLTIDDLAGHALEGLKNFSDASLIEHVKPLLQHDKKWVRDKAKRFIKKLEKKKRKET